MQDFYPSHIYIDPAVEHLPLTQRTLAYFSGVPFEKISLPDFLKKPIPHTEAKKNLLITKHKGVVLKNCQGMGDYVCCNYMTISLVSNCHLECSYCILQDYLHNNPVITFYANVEEILDSVAKIVDAHPETNYRIGTGELSDSLALDDITGFTPILVDFAAKRKNLIIELKTKSDRTDNLLGLDHRGKTVVSWSVNPQKYISGEEHKCASLNERLEAARLVANKGYPVGFHLDPLLALDNWKEEYAGLVNELEEKFESEEIAWISLGSLRYTPKLKEIIRERFPKSRLLYGELFPSSDGKIRYFRGVREKLYRHVKGLIEEAYPTVPNYLCMETKKVWENVYHRVPVSCAELESQLSERFVI